MLLNCINIYIEYIFVYFSNMIGVLLFIFFFFVRDRDLEEVYDNFFFLNIGV